MRINSLDLQAFGPFTGSKIKFSEAPGVIDLLKGGNEAGKTSLLRAVSGLLFGIPHNTGDAFIHPMRFLKIGAELQGNVGDSVTIYRRKGNQNTLLDASGTPLDETAFKLLLGDIDRQMFELIFGLDHDHLREGGLEILAGHGEAGMTLLQAGAGIVSLRKVLHELQAEADNLFRPRGSNQTINCALERIRQLRSQTREESLSSDRWIELSRDLGDVEMRLNQAANRLRDLQSERATADRIRRVLPLAARLSQLLAELEQLRDAPDLPANARDERIELLREIALAQQRSDRAQGQIGDISRELKTISLNQAVLDVAAPIDRIIADRALMHKNGQDLHRHHNEAEELVEQARAVLKAAGIATPLDSIAELIPSKPVMSAIRDLIKRHSTLIARLSMAEVEVRRLDTRLMQDGDTRSAAMVPPDTSTLESTLLEVTKAGPLEGNLYQLQVQFERECSSFDRLLSALGLFSGSAAELESLAVPSSAAIERFASAFQEHREKLKDARRRLAELDEQIQGKQRLRQTLRQDGQVATEGDLSKSRRHRDQGWSLIRRAYIDAHEDISVEATAFSPGVPLPHAYEVAVYHADEIADLLRSASNRAAQLTTLEQQLQESRQAHIGENDRLAQLDADGHALEAEWRQLWQPARIVPLEPADMAEWVRKRKELVAKFASLNATRDSIQVLQEEIARLRSQLQAALSAIGEAPIPGQQALAALASTAQAILKRLTQAHRDRDRLDAGIRDAEADLASRRAELQIADSNLGRWRLDWAKAVKKLWRDADAIPTEIETVLEQLESVREILARLADVRRQISGIRNDLAAYHTRIADLVRVVAPELTDVDTVEAIDWMSAQLSDARKALQRRDELIEQLQASSMENDDAEETLAQDRSVLDRLCREAGCVSPEALPAAEQRADRKRALVGRVDDIERQMLDAGDGKSLAELIAEALGYHIDVVVRRISEIENEVQTLNTTCTELGAKRATVSGQIEVLSRGSSAAAQVAQDAELETASLATEANRYVHLRVAAAILGEGIERYRKRNQGPILGRASELFRRLTSGCFDGLEVELNDRDVPVVVGVRSKSASVTVERMSSGTRDQLFLATHCRHRALRRR